MRSEVILDERHERVEEHLHDGEVEEARSDVCRRRDKRIDAYHGHARPKIPRG